MTVDNQKYALAIHGGCGPVREFSQEMQQAFLRSLCRIIISGARRLAQGRSALDAVEHCVHLLEDDDLYNAGRGSVLTAEGRIEMDASIMDGVTLQAGAVAGLTKAKHPISVARAVMRKTSHVLLAGPGANKFARITRLALRPRSYFVTERRKKQLADARRKGYIGVDHSGKGKKGKIGTVGAVARDVHGNLAAATSTGGLVNKRFGRVSDSALVGCGTYADNATCAVSCTGIGEHFIRTALAKYASDRIALNGNGAASAAREAIAHLREKVQGGYGGVIVVDHNGEVGHDYSTEGMIRAWVREGEEPVCALFRV